uniref:Uncharacterized protein n=1 Tax=viral metagenome TaxID=1070528 RepID=A0A6M3ILE7_9ZZZZ
MSTTHFPGSIVVAGDINMTGALSPTKTRTQLLAITELAAFTVPWTLWRVWDAMQTNLPGTAATDDLALVGGTWASGSPSLQGLDFKASSTIAYARAQIPLPWCYADGQTVLLQFHAGMLTTIADDAATLDVVCYETDEEAGISADLCATAEQSINSLTLADKNFTITPTALVAGDLLDVRIKVSGNDVANATATIPIIGAVQLLCDVR